MHPVACAGFILAGAENLFRGGQNRARSARKNFLPPPVFVSAPPAEFDSAPGAEHTRGGQKIQKVILYFKKQF